MATARKKAPTAAQLRARAAFAKIMKSGGFGAKRKTRKKNPVGRHPGAEMPYQAVTKLDFQRQERALSGARKRRKNPVGRHGGGGRNQYASNVSMPDFTRQSRALSGRKKNPTKPVLAYVVHAARHGVKGAAVGSFPTKPAAVQYAKAWVKLHDCPAMISGRGAR